MEFTIYTFGKIPALWNVLNALAASTGKSWTLSAIGLGGLIGLGYVLLMGMSHSYTLQKATNLAAAWGMIAVLAVTPSTVWVTDLFTNETKKVDNVPMLISAPYSVIGAVQKSLFTNIDGALSSVSGSYISVSQYGLITPIKLLMAMRNSRLAGNLTPDLYNSLTTSMVDCVPGGTLKLPDVMSTRDLIKTLTDNYRQTGFTTWYNSSVPGGMEDIGCADVASKLTTAFQNSYNVVSTSSPVTTILSKAAGTQEGKTYTFNDYQLMYNSLVKSAFTSANAALGQTAGEAATTSLTASTVSYALECMKELASVKNQTLCEAAGLINSDAMEQFKNDSVQNANFFTSIMYSSMAFMTFLFFALSPIVIVVCLIWPMHAVKLFMAYMMFGMWVSSWAVFYAPMGFFIQNEVQNVFAAYAKSGDPFTLANFSSVYADLSTKLAVASNAIATIPLLALALLSGSFFSINSIASRFSGEAHSDPSQMSNRLRSNAAMMQGAPESMQSLTSGLAVKSNAATMKKQISYSTSASEASGTGFEYSNAFATREGLTWTESDGRTHSKSFAEMESYKKDYKSATELGYKAKGFAASMALSSQYRGNLEHFQKQMGMEQKDAAGLIGNLSYLNAQEKHKDHDIASMHAGKVGTTEAERKANKLKADGWINEEMQSLVGQKQGMGAAVAASMAANFAVDVAGTNAIAKAADLATGVPTAAKAAAKKAIEKGIGEIDAVASQKTSETYMHGRGYTKQTMDQFSHAVTLANSVSADKTKSLKEGETFQLSNNKTASETYSREMEAQSMATEAREYFQQDRRSFENNYQKVLDVLNGPDEAKSLRLQATKKQMGFVGLAPGSSEDRIANLAAYNWMTGTSNYDALRTKAGGINHSDLPQKVSNGLNTNLRDAVGRQAPSGADVGPTQAQQNEMNAIGGKAATSQVNTDTMPKDGLPGVPPPTPGHNPRNPRLGTGSAITPSKNLPDAAGGR